MTRCDDCYAQVEQDDWWNHRAWHQDQDDIASDLRAEMRAEIASLADVISDLDPRLEKIEGLAAIFSAFADRQLDKT